VDFHAGIMVKMPFGFFPLVKQQSSIQSSDNLIILSKNTDKPIKEHPDKFLAMRML